MNFNDPFSHGAYLIWPDQIGAKTIPGGVFKFDACLSETVENDAEITEHPVETGASIADHYRLKLRAIKLEMFVSQEPLDPSLFPDAQGQVQGVEYALPAYPATSLLGLVNKGVNIATGGFQTAFVQPPPTTFIDQVLAYSNPIDTLQQVIDQLTFFYENAVLLDVATRSKYYPQHLLGPVTVKRDHDTGTGAIITLELKQVVFVSTSSVAAPPTPVQKKDVPKVDKGKQNPTTTDETSAHYLLRTGSAAIKSYFAGGGT